MIPLTVNPTVVLQLDNDGDVVASASNVAPDLKVVVTRTAREFIDEAANKPFVEHSSDNIYPAGIDLTTPEYLLSALGK